MHMVIVLVTAGFQTGRLYPEIRDKATQVGGDRGHSCRPPKHTRNPNDMKTEMLSIPPSFTPHQPLSPPSLFSQSLLHHSLA